MKKSFVIIGLSLLTFSATLKAQQPSSVSQEVLVFESKHGTETLSTDSAQLAEMARVEEANQLTGRLNQINEMDKSNLDFSERRSLRKEVRSINKALKANSGGIYLSVGAVIIILLLLIILL